MFRVIILFILRQGVMWFRLVLNSLHAKKDPELYLPDAEITGVCYRARCSHF